MDILIKSFNRPYYLDRCLYSIKKHITGYDNIFILDDGTPDQYLDKITDLYSEVKILKSSLHHVKSNSVNNLKEFKIPIDFWVKSAEAASDHFLLLEDDIWVVYDLDLAELNLKLKEKKVVFLKLFWLGNPRLITTRISENLGVINIVKPKLLTNKPYLFKLIFRIYGYKFNKLVGLFRLNSFKNILPYYGVYSVAGAVFEKHYFTSLWNNHVNKIDETLQIGNALKYLKEHSGSQLAQGEIECFKTGFNSSATFGVKQGVTDNVELLKVNNLLNESWLNNQLDVVSSLPSDLIESDIYRLLENETGDEVFALKWKNWVEHFKQKFRVFGCKID